jgi:hypothetical protein
MPETWAVFGTCNEGDDVLGVFTHEPSAADRQELILRLPMYVYGNFRVLSYGPKSRIPNHRTKAGRMKDVRDNEPTGEP